jgi:hypothetical protein
MTNDFSTMKDADMPLLDRIEAALDRIVNRRGLMRIPREATDIDVVVLDCGDEIKRLRAELAAEQSDRSATEEIARQRGAVINALCADIADLKTENAALKAHDPLAEMWRELSEYQPMADADGYGEAWAKMCSERTKQAAERAHDVLLPASSSHEPWLAALSARWAIEWGETSRRNVREAIDSIRRAKEAKP